MIRRPPRSTRTDTLSLHDALPISWDGVSFRQFHPGGSLAVAGDNDRSCVLLIGPAGGGSLLLTRSEEHTSELQSLMRISYAVFCLKKKKNKIHKYLQTRRHLTILTEQT